MAKWRDTPENMIVLAELDTGERVRFKQLKVGDCFRAVSPFDGAYIDPTSHQPSDQWFMAADNPRHADGTETPQDYGWCIACIPIDAPRRQFH